MKTLLVGVVCLISGFLVGVWAPVENESLPVATEAPIDLSGAERAEQHPDSGDALSGLETEPKALEAERAPSGLAAADKDAKMLTVSPSLIGELSRKAGTRSFGQALFERDGVIEEVLGITNEEKAVVQTAWQDTRRAIREIEARACNAEELEDYSVRIQLPDLSQEMKQLERTFSSSVQQTLGENRGDVFLAAKQVDQMITNSGGARTYTVAAEPVGENGWRFRMTQEGPGGRRVWVGDSVPEEIRHLTDVARISPRIDALPE